MLSAVLGREPRQTRQPAAVAGDQPPDVPEAESRARAQADLLRAKAASARQEAERCVREARERLAAAERTAQTLTECARVAENVAGVFDTRAQTIGVERQARQLADAAEARAAALDAESSALATRVDELVPRLEQLRSERETAAAALAQARAAGDVGKVTSLRPQVEALGDVAADLGGQLSAARTRLSELAPHMAGGVLDTAHVQARALRARHDEVLEVLSPAHVDWQTRATLVECLRRAAAAEGGPLAERFADLCGLVEGEAGFAAMLKETRAYLGLSQAC